MKIPVVKRILREDLSGDVPDWVEQVLDPLNQFIDVVVQALRNQLTLGDNLGGKLVTVSLSHNVEISVNPSPLKARVVGLIPLSTGSEALDGYGWQIKDDGQVGVTYRFVSTTATNVECKFFLVTG